MIQNQFIPFILFIFAFVFNSSAQETTIKSFFNEDWVDCKQADASYYRLTTKISDSQYDVKDYLLNDNLQMEGVYMDKYQKTENGRFIYYDSLGFKTKEKNYTRGKLQGIYIDYYDNSTQVASICNYSFGFLNGEYLEYYSDGKERATAQFKNDLIVSTAVRMDKDGFVHLKIENDDKGNGTLVAYYKNNQIRHQGTFVIGNSSNEWKFYNENGSLESKKEFPTKFLSVGEDTDFWFFDGYHIDVEEIAHQLYLPDVEAEYLGGNGDLQKFIAMNVEYPQEAIHLNIQGKVYIAFTVEIDGSISDVKCEKGNPYLAPEGVRLIESMPAWIPGEHAGQKARTRCRIPINFSLDNGKSSKKRRRR